MAIGGPCAIFAPFVFLLFFLLLPFWPIAIVLLGVLWCIVWPLERVAKRFGSKALSGWSAHVAYWFVVVLKPKYYFDPVNVRAARRAKFGIPDRSDEHIT